MIPDIVAAKEEPTDPREPTRYPSSFDFHTSFWAMIYITAYPLEIIEFSSRSRRLLYNFRQWISIHFVCFGNSRYSSESWSEFSMTGGTFIRMDRRDFLDHISNLIGVCNNYFFCFLASEISKFFQHFLGGTQIQRCLFICILRSHFPAMMIRR